jgi:hypothetical protein
MIFRNKDGDLIVICKNQYKNDVLYYKTIMSTISKKVHNENTKKNNQMENMVNTISKILYNNNNNKNNKLV